MITIDNI